MNDELSSPRLAAFSEAELCAITTIILKFLCADTRIAPAELAARSKVYSLFGINFEHEQKLLTLTEACCVIQKMSDEKRSMLKNSLEELAIADGDFHLQEQEFMKRLFE